MPRRHQHDHRHTTTGGKYINKPGHAYRCTLHAARCTLRAQSGSTACDGIWIPRADVEREVTEWLMREAAPGIDTAPPAEGTDEPQIDERALAKQAQAKLKGEYDTIEGALTRLIMDANENPKKYPPGAFERARDNYRSRPTSAEGRSVPSRLACGSLPNSGHVRTRGNRFPRGSDIPSGMPRESRPGTTAA
ncbi:hypothetical protein QQM39_22880 [Streptomyces sp. DT2A-34]|uniref:hypothetical protein n=1 Tax=Streptomyces sp. DT2A-34 TaxID=3051182 RepID=UPI00265C28C2|nr:hypothetical protein [Streptomyces sp. DT2A-34]MDO0913582.1 hypothetical protein [Streptomyces sp. DT2A-34]